MSSYGTDMSVYMDTGSYLTDDSQKIRVLGPMAQGMVLGTRRRGLRLQGVPVSGVLGLGSQSVASCGLGSRAGSHMGHESQMTTCSTAEPAAMLLDDDAWTGRGRVNVVIPTQESLSHSHGEHRGPCTTTAFCLRHVDGTRPTASRTHQTLPRKHSCPEKEQEALHPQIATKTSDPV